MLDRLHNQRLGVLLWGYGEICNEGTVPVFTGLDALQYVLEKLVVEVYY